MYVHVHVLVASYIYCMCVCVQDQEYKHYMLFVLRRWGSDSLDNIFGIFPSLWIAAIYSITSLTDSLLLL